jgi:hypothetical protein
MICFSNVVHVFRSCFQGRLRWNSYKFFESAMAETMSGFNCCCPLRCKGTRSLGKYLTHEAAYAKVIHHLKNSDKHWLEEDAAAEAIQGNSDCIWEDELQVHQDEGVFEEACDARQRDRSRSPVQHRGKSAGKGGHPPHRREEQLVRRATDRVMQNVAFDQQDQKMKVFQFAKTLEKCEAVIKAATQVARQAVACFEDFCSTCI